MVKVDVANVIEMVAIPLVLNPNATWLESSVEITANTETIVETLLVYVIGMPRPRSTAGYVDLSSELGNFRSTNVIQTMVSNRSVTPYSLPIAWYWPRQ